MENNPKLLSTGGISTSNMYSNPIRLEVNEYYDKIEMIYEETSNFLHTGIKPKLPHKRYFKIVFSCVDGKWNKSECIYGKKIQSESYFNFD